MHGCINIIHEQMVFCPSRPLFVGDIFRVFKIGSQPVTEFPLMPRCASRTYSSFFFRPGGGGGGAKCVLGMQETFLETYSNRQRIPEKAKKEPPTL